MASEIVEVSGHIIDSLILPKILDEIIDLDGNFETLDIVIGKRKTDPSTTRLRVSAGSDQKLQAILTRLARLGATPVTLREVQLVRTRQDGVFPSQFYSTTNLPTLVRYRGRWRPVQNTEMDCGIVIDPHTARASCVPMIHVKKGDLVVCGTSGVRVTPLERSRHKDVFQFMGSAVSSEKPKALLIQGVAGAMRVTKRAGQKILVVGGPALVHTGGGPHLERLIESGYVDVLFGGNGLATHDIESVLFGTSLGISLDRKVAARDAHEHHMRAINTIRACGGIRQAVRQGVLTGGIMHACVRHRVPFVLAGSIRDDGPLPDVITDVLRAQDEMRHHLKGVGLALMIASTLHAIATGNLLRATVKTICVDINPAVVTKLADRGTFQGIGIVSDAASFLRELCHDLKLSRR
jgi:lysine-ketoglutarate reductase/saccharopine dehydrogenase-like protein (TIGR00300 family)